MFVVNGHVENLNLRNFVTRTTDSRPLIWTGRDSLIRMLNAELSIYDPVRRSIPIKEEEGSRIERRNIKLEWYGSESE